MNHFVIGINGVSFFDEDLINLSDFIIDGYLSTEEQIRKIKIDLNI